MELRSLLALCLLSVIPAGNADIHILLSMPSLLKGGEPGKACLTVKRHIKSMDFQVILLGETNHTIINDQIPNGHFNKTYEFQVPMVKQPTPVFLLIKAVSGNSNYTAHRSVMLVPPGNVTFIQTDKQLYKGGQEVQMQVMTMDNNLYPVEEMFPELYVTDQDGNLLHRWLNQSTKGSFLSQNFTIVDNPQRGNYNIAVKRQSGDLVTKIIMIDEYAVLSFRVMLKAPKSVTIMDKILFIQLNPRLVDIREVRGKISGKLYRPPTNDYAGNARNWSPDGIYAPFTGTLQSRSPKDKQKNNNPIVYLIDMTSEGVSFNMTLEMRPRVENFQPRTVMVYDCYEKGENGIAELYHPCTLSG